MHRQRGSRTQMRSFHRPHPTHSYSILCWRSCQHCQRGCVSYRLNRWALQNRMSSPRKIHHVLLPLQPRLHSLLHSCVHAADHHDHCDLNDAFHEVAYDTNPAHLQPCLIHSYCQMHVACFSSHSCRIEPAHRPHHCHQLSGRVGRAAVAWLLVDVEVMVEVVHLDLHIPLDVHVDVLHKLVVAPCCLHQLEVDTWEREERTVAVACMACEESKDRVAYVPGMVVVDS